MPEKYLYNGKVYERKDIDAYAKKSGLDTETYLREAGIKPVSDSYDYKGKKYDVAEVLKTAKANNMDFDAYVKEVGLNPVQAPKPAAQPPGMAPKPDVQPQNMAFQRRGGSVKDITKDGTAVMKKPATAPYVSIETEQQKAKRHERIKTMQPGEIISEVNDRENQIANDNNYERVFGQSFGSILKNIELGKLSQSREYKVKEILSNAYNKPLKEDDVVYLANAAPESMKKLFLQVMDQYPEIKNMQDKVKAVTQFHNIITDKIAAADKADRNSRLNDQVLGELGAIDFDVNQVGDDNYTDTYFNNLTAKKDDAIKEIESKYAPMMNTMKVVRRGDQSVLVDGDPEKRKQAEREMQKEMQPIMEQYNTAAQLIGMARRNHYAKSNPDADVIDVGMEMLKYTDPTMYKIKKMDTSGEKSAIDRDIAAQGIEGKYATATDERSAMLTRMNENQLDDRYPDALIAETYHRLGAEYHKSSNWVANMNPSIAEMDKMIEQLPAKYKEVYYKHIRPVEKRTIGSNVPVSGFVNKTAQGTTGVLSSTLNGLKSIFGFGDTKAQTARKILTQQNDTSVQDVGEYAPAKARLAELNKKKDLSVEEKNEKRDLETFVGVRSKGEEIADGAGNILGQVIAQGAMAALTGTALGAAGKFAGIMRTEGAVASGIEGIAQQAVNFGIKKKSLDVVAAAMTSFASSVESSEQMALQMFPDDKDVVKRKVFSNTVSFLNAATEGIFKDKKVLDAFKKEIAPKLANFVTELSLKKLTAESVQPMAKKIISDGLHLLKLGLKENTKETIEEVATSVGTSLATFVLAPSKFNMNDAYNDAVATATSMFIDGSVVGLIAGAKEFRTTRVGIPMLMRVSGDLKLQRAVRADINNRLLNGDMKQSEADEKIAILNDAIAARRTLVKEVDPVKKMSAVPRGKYFAMLTNERMLARKVEQAQDPVIKKQYEDEIKASQKLRADILNNKVYVNDNGGTDPGSYIIDGNEVTRDQFIKVMRSPEAALKNMVVENDDEVSNELEKIGGKSEMLTIEADRIADLKDIDAKIAALDPKDILYDEKKKKLEDEKSETNRYYDALNDFKDPKDPPAPGAAISDKEVTPSYKRNVSVLLTAATVRGADVLTARMKNLTSLYEDAMKQFNATADEKFLQEAKKIEKGILDEAKNEIIETFSKIKGTKVMFKDHAHGAWDGKLEPSFNMYLSIGADTDTQAVSNALFDFAEKYSQDAFFVETNSELNNDFKKEKSAVPLTYDDGTFTHFPQLRFNFDNKSPATTEKLAQLSNALNAAGVKAFTLKEDRLEISILTFLDEEQQKLSDDEQRTKKYEDYDATVRNAVAVWREVFGSEGSLDINIRKSRNGTFSTKAYSDDPGRPYDRSDILKETASEVAEAQKQGLELGKIRDKQIALQEQGKDITDAEKKRLDELSKVVQPIIEETFQVQEESFKKAKKEIEDIAAAAISKVKGSFVSVFPIKRPSRASVKVMRWYSAFTERLGDGARVNIIVNNIKDADAIYEQINKQYPKSDPSLRRINDPTELGYPKRLIEIRTSEGIIAELQVMTQEAYLAKDGLQYFEVGDKKDKAASRLKALQDKIGWAIPDGLGHYFYEIERDFNVPKKLREEAKRLSVKYYDAFANPEKKSWQQEEFTKEMSAFRQNVDKADKKNWDAGNDGKSPDSLNRFLKINNNENIQPQAQDNSKPVPGAGATQEAGAGQEADTERAGSPRTNDEKREEVRAVLTELSEKGLLVSVDKSFIAKAKRTIGLSTKPVRMSPEEIDAQMALLDAMSDVWRATTGNDDFYTTWIGDIKQGDLAALKLLGGALYQEDSAMFPATNETNRAFANVTLAVLSDPLFKKMEGQIVAVQSLRDGIKGRGKQIEKDIINLVLSQDKYKELKKVPFSDFRNDVEMQVMKLERIKTTTHNNYGMDNLGDYGTQYGDYETVIFNSPINHGDHGHFRGDFVSGNSVKVKWDMRQLPGTNTWVAIDSNMPAGVTGATIQSYVGTAGSKESVESWIKVRESANDSRPITKGLFGHIRAWFNKNEGIMHIAELQSDYFQKVDALTLNEKYESLIPQHEIDIAFNRERNKTLDKQVANRIAKELGITVKKSAAGDSYSAFNKSGNLINTLMISPESDFPGLEEGEHEKYLIFTNALNRIAHRYDAQMGTVQRDDEPLRYIAHEPIHGTSLAEFATIEEAREFIVDYNNERIKADDLYNELNKKYIEQTEKIRIKVLNELVEKVKNDDRLNNIKKQFIASQKIHEDRLLREAIKYAAEKGAKVLRFPRPYTLAHIEYYVTKGDADGRVAEYEIIEGNRDRLYQGDVIEYGGENYTVIDAGIRGIVVAPSDEVNIYNFDDLYSNEIDYYRSEYDYELNKNFDDIRAITRQELEDWSPNDWTSEKAKELMERYFEDNPDEETASFKEIDSEIDDYISSDVYERDITDMIGSDVVYSGGYNTLYSAERRSSVINFDQPDENYGSRSHSEDDYEDNLDSDQKTVINKYKNFNKYIEKTRPDAREVVDDNDMKWLEFDITDADRENPVIAFQREGAKVKGAIDFMNDNKATVHLFDGADISTLAHEFTGHLGRRVLEKMAETSPEFSKHYDAIKKWAGVKDNNWSTRAEEKFARGFEKYLRTGKAPTKALENVFGQLKKWLTGIYEYIKGSSLDIKLTPEVIDAFDAMLGKGTDTRAKLDALAAKYFGEQPLNQMPEVNEGQPLFQQPSPLESFIRDAMKQFKGITADEIFNIIASRMPGATIQNIQKIMDNNKPMTKAQVNDAVETAAVVGNVKAKNVKGLYEIYKKMFGLSDAQALANAIATDIMIGNMAKRNGLTKEGQYRKLAFEKGTPTNGAKGSMRILADGKVIVAALTNPDVSTPLHEMAHVWETVLTDAERAAILKWAGHVKWTRATSEKFARGFERYLATGKADNPKIQALFDKFKTWLTDLYNGIMGSQIDLKLNDAMSNIYGEMMAATDAEIQELATMLGDKQFNKTLNEIIDEIESDEKLRSGTGKDQQNAEAAPQESTTADQAKTDTAAQPDAQEGRVPDGDQVGQPTAPQSDAPVQETEDGAAKPLGIKHKDSDTRKNMFGLGESYEGMSTTEEAIMAEAQQKIKDGYDVQNLLDVMERSMHNPTALENAILAIYMASLDNEMRDNPNTATLVKMKRATELLDLAGSRTGLMLYSRKLIGQTEITLSDFLIVEAMAAGVDVQDIPKDMLDNLTEQYLADEQIRKELDEYKEKFKRSQDEVRRLRAQAKVAKEAKKISRTRKKRTAAELDIAKKTIAERIREKLEKLRGKTDSDTSFQSNADPDELRAISDDVNELLRVQVDGGITRYEDVVDSIYNELNQLVPNLSKNDIRDLIAGEYSEQRTRTQTAADIRNLKTQAKLLLKIEELEAGKKRQKNLTQAGRTSKEIRDLQEKIKDLERKLPKAARTVDQRTEAKKSFLKTQIAKMEHDLATGNVRVDDPEPPPIKLDDEMKALLDKHIEFVRKTHVRREKLRHQQMSGWQKAWEYFVQATEVRRVVQLSLDFSIPFRQGLLVSMNPRNWDIMHKVFWKMFPSFARKKYYDNIMYNIRENPMYHESVKDGIAFTEVDSRDNMNRDEDFRKSFVYHIPVVGWFLEGSNRAANTFHNMTRMEMYLKGVERLKRQGYTRDANPEHYQALAKWVMNATGRGNMLKGIEESKFMKEALGWTFYGARLYASRINLINPVYYKRMPKAVRVEALKDMTSTAVTISAAMFGLVGAGATVGFDPDDPDFLKVKFGDKRYDLTGGISQYVRTFLRVIKRGGQLGDPIAGAIVNKIAGEGTYDVISKDESQKYGKFTGKSLTNFLRYKLATTPQYIWSAVSGKDPMNKDFDASDFIKIYPMYVDDLIDAWDKDGGMAVPTILIPSIFGIGTQYYSKDSNIRVQEFMGADQEKLKKLYEEQELNK